ncbi:MAG: V-type ATP synthase subunit D [Cryobacterium sp.]|nr:V-type ATP synthase subunit D [Cryobacterium sp.]
MQQHANRARGRLDEAVAEAGPEAVSSASFAATGRVGVELSVGVVAGVVLIDLVHEPVRRSVAARGYAVSTTAPEVDAAAAAYEEEVQLLLDLASLELSVRRLAEEIGRTTRQVNALEHVVIPRLRADARRIALVLDEREREESARLKRARERARRRSASNAPPRDPTVPPIRAEQTRRSTL